MYTLLKQEGHARRGIFETVHGTVQTPAFMNVGTSAAIKGGISSIDDVRTLMKQGLYGAICGKSLYAGTLGLGEAVRVGGEQNVG